MDEIDKLTAASKGFFNGDVRFETRWCRRGPLCMLGSGRFSLRAGIRQARVNENANAKLTCPMNADRC